MNTFEDLIKMSNQSTIDHQDRVAELAAQIGNQLMLPHDVIDNIKTIGRIHDIGKKYLPLEFFARTCGLSPTEREIVQKHPQDGFDILANTDLSDVIKESVLQHHEHLDGSGYPRNLKGNKILTEVKVVSVADVVDAMTSGRPYNTGLQLDDAISELTSHEGTYYDPLVVSAYLRVLSNKRRFDNELAATASRLKTINH